jgi:hypothetical protein
MNIQNQSMHPNPAPEEQRVNVGAHGEADMEWVDVVYVYIDVCPLSHMIWSLSTLALIWQFKELQGPEGR